MSIRKKLLIFVILLVVTPMLILFFSSTVVINKQKHENELRYLQSALKVVRIQMQDRRDEMERSGQRLVEDGDFSRAIRSRDRLSLTEALWKLKQVYAYLDIAVVLGTDKRPVAGISNDIRTDKDWLFNGLTQVAAQQKRSLSSEEVLPLAELFYPASRSYDRFCIPIVNRLDAAGGQVYLEQCQIGLAIVPVYDPAAPAVLLGYLVLGDILNNDPYFPARYSQNVQGSYLAFSIDGIRIASNIKTPTKESYIGSGIPVKLDGPEHYFGRVDFNDEVHVFLDETVVNHRGEPVAVIGVGIPEKLFAQILSTNQYLILSVTLFCLSVMLAIGRYFATVITEPIMLATQFAEQLANGNRNPVLQPEWTANQSSETGILLMTLQKMKASLEASEQQNETYLEKLKQEHLTQIALSEQLKAMNDELEVKVADRTMALLNVVDALKKANGVKSQFLANMSHELRTPLSAIISSSEALIGGVFGPLTEKQEKHIRHALNSGRHLLQLINDILDICKIEAGKMNLTFSEFYTADVIEDACNVVRNIAVHKNIDVAVRLQPPDIKIRADATKVKQILYNLLSNAVKFTPENGKVEIDAEKQGDVVQVRVRDNGIGIKTADQERVFIEFEQVDNSYQRNYEGTGLGLSLTKKLVEMHKGQIFLFSQENIGTEIIFTLPQAACGKPDDGEG